MDRSNRSREPSSTGSIHQVSAVKIVGSHEQHGFAFHAAGFQNLQAKAQNNHEVEAPTVAFIHAHSDHSFVRSMSLALFRVSVRCNQYWASYVQRPTACGATKHWQWLLASALSGSTRQINMPRTLNSFWLKSTSHATSLGRDRENRFARSPRRAELGWQSQ